MMRARPAGVSVRYVVDFEYISTPTCTHIPQQSTPEFTLRFRVSPSPVRAHRVPRECALPIPVPKTTNTTSNPRLNRFPFLSSSSQHLRAPPKTTQSARRSWEELCQCDKLALPTLGPEAKSRHIRISGYSTLRDRTFYTRLKSH
jgi:hypothetical protein